MNFRNVKNFVKIVKHTLIKNSPEILIGVGAVSFVATIIAAGKETINEQDILEDHRMCLDAIEVCHDNEDLDDKAYKKTKMEAYRLMTWNTTKNYFPAVLLGTTSLACFFGAFGMMRKRYATLVVAYTALDESFRRYRQRVIEDKGAEADLYYLTGSKVKELTVKDEDGNKVKQKTLILPDGSVASPYAFKFSKYKENGERNWQWTNDQVMNRSYVMGQQDWLNDQLYTRCVFDSKHRVKVRGWVFLNEARDLLGEDGNTAGSVVGWRMGNGEPGSNGYIDFRITEATEKDPETGEDIPCMFINPNVDGLIYDIIGKKEAEPFELSYDVWGELLDYIN